MTISKAVTTLTILREQMKVEGWADSDFDELTITESEIRMKRRTKTMTIPLVAVSCIGPETTKS